MRCGQRGCAIQPEQATDLTCPTCNHPLVLVMDEGDHELLQAVLSQRNAEEAARKQQEAAMLALATGTAGPQEVSQAKPD